jgi:hypothetical protein
MTRYKYYLIDDGAGIPHEIFRGNFVSPVEFSPIGLRRAKKDGSWSDDPDEASIVLRLNMRGDFDPEDDEITEVQAMAYLDQWRAGTWPGRE